MKKNRKHLLQCKRGCLILLILFCSLQYAEAQLSIGTVAPDFTVTDMNGDQHNLYSYLDDGKYVILKFGFVGCGSCESSRPAFNNAYRNYGCNERDVVLLEFDVSYSDGDINPALWESTGLANQQAIANGIPDPVPLSDIDYVMPEAPYITLTGGADGVRSDYQVASFTTEFVIEPVNKTIEGSSDVGVWSGYFGSMVMDGSSDLPGVGIMMGMEVLHPEWFSHVPVMFVSDYVNGLGTNFVPPLNGSQAGDTPFTSFCQTTPTGCDLLKPEIVSESSTPDSDTTYALTVSWTGTGQCDDFEVLYGLSGAGMTTVSTDQTSITIPGLYSGRYKVMVRCACNQIYSFDKIFPIVGAETDFTLNSSCDEICYYKLVPFGTSQMTEVWWDRRIRVESEGIVEFYTLHDNAQEPENDTLTQKQTFTLAFCKGSDVDLQFINPALPFMTNPFDGTSGYPKKSGGFRLLDDQDNVVEEFIGPELGGFEFHAQGYPGYSDHDFVADCQSSSGVGLGEVEMMDFIVYPNPFTNSFTVQMNDEIIFEASDIMLHDLLGRTIPVEIVQENDAYRVNLLGRDTGVFFVKVHTLQGELIRKIERL